MSFIREDISEPEQMKAQAIVVIHPGSQNLRIGRASDPKPVTVLHAIARRRKPEGTFHQDPSIAPAIKTDKGTLKKLEESRLSLSHLLQSCLMSNGKQRYATSSQQIASFNKGSKPVQADDATQSKCFLPDADTDCIIGNQILEMQEESLQDFNLHFPMKRGELNIHKGPSGTLTAIMADLQAIWEFSLSHYFSINLKDLKHYRAVLIIPDIYNRTHLKTLVHLLLKRIGFGGCFLVQDHVAGTFGAGLPHACVVDVGDQKTSISCVEDGISHVDTRVRLGFGGGDISQALHYLMKKCSIPFSPSNPVLPYESQLLHRFKEDFCHVNLDICGPQEKVILIERPGEKPVEHVIQVGDECLVAPLSMFQPDLLAITGEKEIQTQKPSVGDPDDPHDLLYLKETTRRGARGEEQDEDAEIDLEDSSVSEGQNGKTLDIPMGLDSAILWSIDQCPWDDLKRKMYSCVLVIGGGFKFHGVGTWLKNRLSLQIPYSHRPEVLDVVTRPKDMDPQMTVWKGAAIMSCLETAQELWISQKEWTRFSVKILREKVPFIW